MKDQLRGTALIKDYVNALREVICKEDAGSSRATFNVVS